jgi:transposase
MPQTLPAVPGPKALVKPRGSNTKLAVIIDALGRALGINLVPGNWHNFWAEALLIDKFTDSMAITDRDSKTKSFREKLACLSSTPCIPRRLTERIQHYYSALAHAHRHVVENFFDRLKHHRRIRFSL